PPAHGQRFRTPELAETLRAIAESGQAAFYSGPVADAIVDATWLSHDDLADYRPRWVTPIVQSFHGLAVAELPSPTQGVAALEALAILGDAPEVSLTEEVRAVALALEDALAHVRDGADVGWLLSHEHVERRRTESARGSAGP